MKHLASLLALVLLPNAGCQGASPASSQLDAVQPAEQSSVPLLGWVIDERVSEHYLASSPPGRIELDVTGQLLRISIPQANKRAIAEFRIAERVPDVFAVTFTQLNADSVLLAGANKRTEVGVLLRLTIDPNTGVVQAHEDLWTGPELSVVSSLAVLPDGGRVAMLDHPQGAVAVYNFATEKAHVVADASKSRWLSSMKYLTVRDLSPSGGVAIVATEASEPDLGNGRLAGRSVTIADRDGDGVFETVF